MPDPLAARLKVLIVETLKLDDVRPEDDQNGDSIVGGKGAFAVRRCGGVLGFEKGCFRFGPVSEAIRCR